MIVMLESFMRSFGYEKKRARVDDVLSVIGILPITDEAVTSARHSVVDKYEALAFGIYTIIGNESIEGEWSCYHCRNK